MPSNRMSPEGVVQMQERCCFLRFANVVTSFSCTRFLRKHAPTKCTCMYWKSISKSCARVQLPVTTLAKWRKYFNSKFLNQSTVMCFDSYMIQVRQEETMPDKKFISGTMRAASSPSGWDRSAIRRHRTAHCKWGTMKVGQFAVLPLVYARFKCCQKCLFLWFCQSSYFFFQYQFISTFWKLTTDRSIF